MSFGVAFNTYLMKLFKQEAYDMTKLNRKRKNGSWVLSGTYLAYRASGGTLSPMAWNKRITELNQEASCTYHKKTEKNLKRP